MVSQQQTNCDLTQKSTWICLGSSPDRLVIAAKWPQRIYGAQVRCTISYIQKFNSHQIFVISVHLLSIFIWLANYWLTSWLTDKTHCLSDWWTNSVILEARFATTNIIKANHLTWFWASSSHLQSSHTISFWSIVMSYSSIFLSLQTGSSPWDIHNKILYDFVVYLIWATYPAICNFYISPVQQF